MGNACCQPTTGQQQIEQDFAPNSNEAVSAVAPKQQLRATTELGQWLRDTCGISEEHAEEYAAALKDMGVETKDRLVYFQFRGTREKLQGSDGFGLLFRQLLSNLLGN